MYKAILHILVAYILSLIVIAITKHVFINMFKKKKKKNFLAVKFEMGYEINMSFLVIPKFAEV